MLINGKLPSEYPRHTEASTHFGRSALPIHGSSYLAWRVAPGPPDPSKPNIVDSAHYIFHQFQGCKDNSHDATDTTEGLGALTTAIGEAAGFCYITTACVKSMGLPDNCPELQTLRYFRDKILMSSATGKKAVNEYYQIAPEIIQALEENEKENTQKVWTSLYCDIRRAVFLVLSGNFELAFKHYQQVTLALKNKYLR
ncbi:MAG: CFI-box-CTERM domain-containing protein [Planctomycetota bacterium]|jgi:hypothetical protein